MIQFHRLLYTPGTGAGAAVRGGQDDGVVRLTERAAQRLTVPHELRVLPGATHLFPQQGALAEVGAAAAGWFTQTASVG
ncbi:hypothetical protein AA958_01030 [Streptomyces sp. CNQ-509]|uniref:hypothetical protein n=1 Tax=unclassified Streptomyces TaxID=2593676 RepID=UPI00062DF6D8|nr:hypothetical protein [Streptomyces sp. CNQ-509]AKH80985.1 hypothetical protein AA958_01030 [Streptomyces sp. CNQ-509]